MPKIGVSEVIVLALRGVAFYAWGVVCIKIVVQRHLLKINLSKGPRTKALRKRYGVSFLAFFYYSNLKQYIRIILKP